MGNDKTLGKFKLFRIMTKIGCIGFGGGNALIPVMQKELVEETKAVKPDDFDEDVVVASITPGALPVEIAGGVGSRIFGWRGMLLGSVGMALPGVFLTLVFLSCLSGLDKDIARQINFLTVGISAYIVCLLMDYVASTLRRAKTASGMAQMWLVIGIVFLLTCGKTLYRLMEISSPPMFGLATIHVFAVAFFLIFYDFYQTFLFAYRTEIAYSKHCSLALTIAEC
ncbi:MAG: chromate transporter [Selenomonadaceae bacterium]|nr:chromate transporter [Selenomonadaceae bacterium]